MKKLIYSVTSCLLTAGAAQAATIAWASVQNITGNASDVSTLGTSVYAYSLDVGSGTNTVNGVTFKQDNPKDGAGEVQNKSPHNGKVSLSHITMASTAQWRSRV